MSSKFKSAILTVFSLIVVIAICLMLVFIFQDNQETDDTPKYKITFYANQEVVKEVESSGYEIIVAPSPLNIDGYTFVGWFFDENTWQDE